MIHEEEGVGFHQGFSEQSEECSNRERRCEEDRGKNVVKAVKKVVKAAPAKAKEAVKAVKKVLRKAAAKAPVNMKVMAVATV